MRILIVGAGAVGGLFGGLMAAAGRDVTFLLRPERAAQVRDEGLTIVGGPGLPDVDGQNGVTVNAPVLTAAELRDGPRFDLVVLATKAYGLESAVIDVGPAVRNGATVLPLLNGMRHIDRLVAEFGGSSVLGGYAFVSSYLDERGRVLAGPVAPAITYGERDGSDTERLRAFDAAARDCGFTATRSAKVTAEMWAKWVFLAAFAGTNVLSGGTLGQASSAPGGVATITALLAETASVAEAAGFRPSDGKLAKDLTILTDTTSGNRASMDKDRRAGRPVEDEAIIGDLVDRADRAGLPVPLLRATRMALGVYRSERESTG
ncbi:2-dehydropantoate 2-reductase [Nakamurella flava]|uniref:2-dehydropantoate 2-reductase n=1 Tax=Nakamurella flava TaxID=2576308 RepID=A0A4U6QF35_9ACTN|nr:2-dehydropantoate 2-reductase [Nakamurella flava]TKV58616.1 2-dehydropantoate 2-reductase [Nakamurella flava]